jgi:glycosyltransferase involved in cell wall biosynthesis
VIGAFDVALAPYPELPHDFYFSPLKLFEYLGCGVATVASAVGQIAELVQSGVHALLVPAADDAAMADACRQLLDDPAAARSLGARGSAVVHDRYTWDRNAAVATSVGARVP